MTAVATSSRARQLYDATHHIVGQQKARKQLAVLLERQLMVSEGVLPRSSGAIVSGRTGVGKTVLVRTMCSLLGIPFCETNATQYSDVGFVGMDLGQMFVQLLNASARLIDERHGHLRLYRGLDGAFESAEADPSVFKRRDYDEVLERAETGVILLDEGDKWMQVQGQSRDPQSRNIGLKLQAELLKMVEGGVEYLKQDADDESGHPFDTSKVLIILAGAFVGLPDQARRRLHSEDQDVENNEAWWDQIEPQDFVGYGMIPELAGRLSTIIFLRPLKPSHLAEIMTQEGGVADEYRSRFEHLGLEWDVTEGGLLSLAQQALDRKMGARALEHVMWINFSEALFEASEGRGTRVFYDTNEHRARVL